MRQLVWFRNDLRVADHPALHAATGNGQTIACYCICTAQWRSHDMGDRRIAFQQRALRALSAELAELNIPLLILHTPTFADVSAALLALCNQHEVANVHFNDEYPLNERRRDLAVEQDLTAAGIPVQRYTADTLFAPGTLLTSGNKPYTVFSPFFKQWRNRLEQHMGQPLPAPQTQSPSNISSDPIPESWDGVCADLAAEQWPADEATAQRTLFNFADERMANYGTRRDIPSEPGTSGLSAHLAIGTVSARTCVATALKLKAGHADSDSGAEKWIAELAWRDFYRHIVALFDHVNYGFSFKRDYDRLQWRVAPDELEAWQRGETGYPLVDAGMRQLREIGWMHNRVRMVTAMFLTKHLLIDWREGERYFMQQLVDGDFPSNNGGWQWSASVGTDAAPYFRIFNPASQGERFDPKGIYVKRWVAELDAVSARQLFKAPLSTPAASQGDLLAEEVTYPAPIVDHKAARERALAFFKGDD